MANEEEIIGMILTINTVLMVIGGIIFGFACLRQRELIPWLPIFIILAIGNFFFTYQFVDYVYQLIAYSLFGVAAIFTFNAAFMEYYKLFIKNYNQKSQTVNSISAIIVIMPIIIGFQIFVLSILISTIIMLLRIYIKTRSPSRFLFMLSIIAATIAMFFISLDSFGVEWAFVFGNIIVTSYMSVLVVAAIVALLEQEITGTISEKNNLKDKFSHDLGNILHSISITFDLIKTKGISDKELSELEDLLRKKIHEASDLVKEIRKL
jgi:hypothetical protein